MAQQFSQLVEGSATSQGGGVVEGRRIPIGTRQQQGGGGPMMGAFLGQTSPVGKVTAASGSMIGSCRGKQTLAGPFSPKGHRQVNPGCQVGELMTHNVPFVKSSSVGNEFSTPSPLGNFLSGKRCSGGVDPSSPFWLQSTGLFPDLGGPSQNRLHGPTSGYAGGNSGGFSSRASHRDRRHHYGGGRHSGNNSMGAHNGGSSSNFNNPNRGGNSLVPSPPPPNLGLIQSMAGDALQFSETNMDWTKLNIFRTRLCDRLTQTHSCHMVNRCLFSHDVNWPRRTPFLPRATALTLRYIPVWCPRLEWPPLVGLCDSEGKITWTSSNDHWDPRTCHQNCSRNDNCPFVHNLEEFLYHPEVYKTRTCCLANDGSFEEQMNSSCMALCPWYFCPFAHDIYELRDLKGTRYAWHPPPQIVDNQFVARTQGFDELEMQIIDFIRKAPNGSYDLYSSSASPLKKMWRDRMPPVIRPMKKTLVEELKPSLSHLEFQFDDLLYVMIIASFLNLLLYPVENFYVPTLVSLQGAVLRFQLGLPIQQYESAWLVQQYDSRANGLLMTATSSSSPGSKSRSITDGDFQVVTSDLTPAQQSESLNSIQGSWSGNIVTMPTTSDKLMDSNGMEVMATSLSPSVNRNPYIKRWASTSSTTTADHSVRSKKNEPVVCQPKKQNSNNLFYGNSSQDVGVEVWDDGSTPTGAWEVGLKDPDSRATTPLHSETTIPLFPFTFSQGGAYVGHPTTASEEMVAAENACMSSTTTTDPICLSHGDGISEMSKRDKQGSSGFFDYAAGEESPGLMDNESSNESRLPASVPLVGEYAGPNGGSFLDNQQHSGGCSTEPLLKCERGRQEMTRDDSGCYEGVFTDDMCALLESLGPEELLQIMAIISTNSDPNWSETTVAEAATRNVTTAAAAEIPQEELAEEEGACHFDCETRHSKRGVSAGEECQIGSDVVVSRPFQ